jgi:subtilisin family serine protease
VDFAFARGIFGQGLRFTDVEYDWRLGHEDLVDAGIGVEPGQTPSTPIYSDHGTAVMGMVSAPPNGYGVTGMAPLAAPYVYPEVSLEEGWRRVTAVTHALADSSSGDVVLLEMQDYGPTGGFVPAEIDLALWLVVKAGTDAGVVVVAAAGNGDQDLDGPAFHEYMSRGDSGAIIVGAGYKTDRCRQGYSTHGSRVNLQGWGGEVFSLGYGDYAKYGNDPNQTYTDTFSGTSSASPFVAAAAVLLQNWTEREFGYRLTPTDLRGLLIDTGKPQCTNGLPGHIGPLPDIRAAFRALTPLPPPPPADLVVAGVTATAIRLRWNDQAWTELGYEVALLPRGKDPGQPANWINVSGALPPNKAGFNVLGLEPKTKYEFKVRCWNSHGFSEYGNTVSTKTN